jgi:spore photoproduct lyase
MDGEPLQPKTSFVTKIRMKNAGLFQPEIILVEKEAQRYPLTQALMTSLPGVPVREIESCQNAAAHEWGLNRRIAAEKRSLILAVKKGELVKPVERDLFRATPHEYYIIHSMGCPFDCEYCFLYDYLDHQRPTIFVNMPDLLARIAEVIDGHQHERELIFHAGEFSDALAYDHLTNLSRPLVELFATQPRARLELRTKSAYVDNLLGLSHHGRTIVSWTFNTEEIARRIEHQTASLRERLAAARRVQAHGYWAGIRFDPIVWYPDWREGYRKMIAEVFSALDARLIADVSLGMFRATPGLKRVIQQRVRRSWLLAGEMVLCEDGKYRASKPVRREMYRALAGWIRELAPQVKIDSCMEAPEVAAVLAQNAFLEPKGCSTD